MNPSRRHFVLLMVSAIAFIGPEGAALAQDWPTRPLTMIVTFAPGGTNDTVARILAPRMGERGRARKGKRCRGD